MGERRVTGSGTACVNCAGEDDGGEDERGEENVRETRLFVFSVEYNLFQKERTRIGMEFGTEQPNWGRFVPCSLAAKRPCIIISFISSCGTRDASFFLIIIPRTRFSVRYDNVCEKEKRKTTWAQAIDCLIAAAPTLGRGKATMCSAREKEKKKKKKQRREKSSDILLHMSPPIQSGIQQRKKTTSSPRIHTSSITYG